MVEASCGSQRSLVATDRPMAVVVSIGQRLLWVSEGPPDGRIGHVEVVGFGLVLVERNGRRRDV
jgi:hypothetical protein